MQTKKFTTARHQIIYKDIWKWKIAKSKINKNESP